jgi:hypothetical protein
VTYAPLLHWIIAAAWANYTPDEFFELDGEMQSSIVAAYETHSQIEAVLADDHARKMKAKTRRKA